MIKKLVLFVAPYSKDEESASSRYLIELANQFCKYHNVTFYHHRWLSKLDVSIIQLPIFGSQLSKIFGTRIMSLVLLLRFYFLRNGKRVVITDLNPCINLCSNDFCIYHVIHHIDDFPFLSRLLGAKFMNYFETVGYRQLIKYLWKVLLKYSPSRLICVSHTVASQIKALCNDKFINVIRNANQVEYELKSNTALIEKQIIIYDIIMVGNNVHRKNYPMAIKIINSVQDCLLRPLRVAVVGKNSNLIQEGLLSQVKFSSFTEITSKELVGILSTSQIFMSTSVLEGYCIPFVEAQYIGRPCVVPNQPIFKENSYTNLVYYCQHDAKEYTDVILKILDTSISYEYGISSNLDMTKYDLLSNSQIIRDASRLALFL